MVGGVWFVLCIVFCLRKLSDGMFLESCRAVAKQYPSIEYTELGMHNTILQVGVGAAKGWTPAQTQTQHARTHR